MKKAKKQIRGLGEGVLTAAGASMGLAGMGATGTAGTIVAAGQRGLVGVTRHMPTMGKVVGAGMIMRTLGQLEPKKRKRKR